MTIAYQVVPEFAFGYNRAKRVWEKVDVALAVPALLNTYHLMEIGVTAMAQEYTFYPHYHLADLAGELGTLQDWFNARAGVAMPDLADGYPSLTFGSMHYQSLYADFKVKAHLTPPGFHFSQDFSLDDASDIVLEMASDLQMTYAESVLYFVNGQAVPHVLDDAGVRLNGAGNIVRRIGKPNISCMVFNGIGAVSTHPLKNLTIEKMDVTRDWYSTLLIRTPQGLSGSTAAVVIAGVLHWISPRDYINETTLRISLPNYRLVETLLASRDYYDWDDIGVGDLSLPASVAKIRDPETFRSLLNHESSFLVLISNPYLELSNVPIDHAAADGVFYLRSPLDPDGKEPLGPLIDNRGKVVDYWPTFEEGRWTLETSGFSEPRWLYDQARWHRQARINDVHAFAPDDWRKKTVEMLRIRARIN